MTATPTPAPVTVRRADYAPPAFWIDRVHLTLDLDAAKTRVLNRMTLRRNPDVPAQPLRLDGEELTLARVQLNGAGCPFRLDGEALVLENLPEGDAPFELEIFTTCCPEKNTCLMGLYMSGSDFFTQCEAEGFRRITYFLDRPDVMAEYTVTLRADKTACPVLLSNGNLLETGDLDDGRHFATWHDPHKKPCYLFAIVAGRLAAREQRITTRSGAQHLLQVYVRPGDLDKTGHAMRSLIAAITWDEARFGRKLDLERFAIVATNDFTMGAMENKGLNIFNSKFVLAKPDTATDEDFAGVESVIGHEYFHNWTGNRITCRDWFQLSLKEGLTVFRDQEFSQDMAGSASARAVCRIKDVLALRASQFPEDAGPMAHPVRPDEYQEISNFYTTTVYEKGAEVVRLYQTLLGVEGFRRGMDLYFERHDGQAVTCDDFAQAMSDANPASPLPALLAQFKRWYAQAGTPVVTARGRFDAGAQTYTLTLSQRTPPTPGQAEKLPFVIPVRLGLIASDGSALPLTLAGSDAPPVETYTALLTEESASFTFTNIAAEPVPSLLRGFSAPVRLDADYSPAALRHLLAHDSDPFARWEAGQTLMLRLATQLAAGAGDIPAAPLADEDIAALRAVLTHPQLDAGFKALALTLPSETIIAEQLQPADPQRIHAVRRAMQQQLAAALHDDWQRVWDARERGAWQQDTASAGRRALAAQALAMLCLHAQATGDAVWPGRAYQLTKDAGNMSERLAALRALIGAGHPLAERALAQFYARYAGDALVIDKWFALQATAPDEGGSVLAQVQRLMAHPDFTLKNPNRARALIFSYCIANPAAFHRADAAGYSFWAEQVLALDAINPQVAARLARALERWAALAEPYRSAARAAIAHVAERGQLSRDVREITTRALAQAATKEENHA